MTNLQPICDFLADASSFFFYPAQQQNQIIPHTDHIALLIQTHLKGIQSGADHCSKLLQKTLVPIIKEQTAIIEQNVKVASAWMEELFTRVQKNIQKECTDGISSVFSLCILPSLIVHSSRELQSIKRDAAIEIEEINKTRPGTAKIIQCGSLDGISLTHSREVNPESKTIVYFPGNQTLWQFCISTFLDWHIHTGADVICYNYRGTGGNLLFPLNEDDIVNDGLIQIKKLINEGVAPNRIFILGNSFGGGDVISIASLLEDEGYSISVGNDRSFESLYVMIKKIVGKAFPFLAKTCADLASDYRWRLDSGANLSKLKGHLVVIDNKRDDFIDPTVSFRSAVDKAPSLQVRSLTIIDMDDQEYRREHQNNAARRKENPHSRPFSQREKEAFFTALKKIWG